MVSIVSNSRPITTGDNINTTSSGGIATNNLRNSDDKTISQNTSYKLVPGINQYETPTIRQQAIKPETINTDKPEVVYQNRYLNNASNAPQITNNKVLTNDERSALSILSNWGNKLKATNSANNVTTYTNDKSTVPLLRRDTNGFINVDYNSDGTYHVSTTGIKIPFTDTTVGNYDLGNLSWNPIKSYSVSYPIGDYLMSYKYYDTKNRLVQGTRAIATSYSNYYDGANNIVDDYAIKEWGNLVDMSINWKDRNAMQNTIAGLNTVTGLSQRYGFNDYLGGNNVVGGVQNLVSLYTFGNSVYQLGNNWSKMSNAEKAISTLHTINAGAQAYSGVQYLSSLYSSLSSSAEAAVASTGANAIASTGASAVASTGASAGASAVASTGANVGASAGANVGANVGASAGEAAGESMLGNVAGTTLQALGFVAAAYSTYNYFDSVGDFRNTAEGRKAGALSGASAGASIGACCFGPVGAVVGAAIGSIVGTIQVSAQGGKSTEQFHRDLYRSALSQSGIVQASKDSSEILYQLADGQYYNIGVDGHAGRATDINGVTKTVYNKDMIADYDKKNIDKINGEVRPYDIDYTCNMDYTGSLLLAPLNALGLGGSNSKDSSEYNQMLGYLTNACTSNVERDFTKDNFNKMVDNIKAGYERVGITNKQDSLNALGLAYMQGRLTEDDLNSYKLAVDILYSSNGYDRAQTLMDQLGRNQSKQEPVEVTTEEATEKVEETTKDKNKDKDNTSSIANKVDLEIPKTTATSVSQEKISAEERYSSKTNKPIPETATEDVDQSQITPDMNSEGGNLQGVQG